MSENLEKEIQQIIERNKRVELDKAWETSFVRRLIVTLITYFTVLIFMMISEFPNPWLGACVPAIGYILSTLTLPIFKKIWAKNKKR